MKKHLVELVQYRELLWNLTVSELKVRYRGSILGFLWTVLNPLFYLLILAVVFSKIMKFQIDNYTIFLFVGLTSWFMIQQTIVIATASIVNNQGLIKKVYIPKIVFPLSNVLARFVDHTIMTVVLLGLAIFFKMPITWNWLFIPVIVLLHFFFSIGLSLMFSVMHIKIRDTQHILSIIFQALFYVTPIIYSLEILPEKYRQIFLLNPFYYFVQVFRYPVYYTSFPPVGILLITLALTALSLLLGLVIFYKKEKEFVFYLS